MMSRQKKLETEKISLMVTIKSSMCSREQSAKIERIEGHGRRRHPR